MEKLDLDKYYTKEKIAKSLVLKTIEILKKHINLENILWIEPSAGSGSFLKYLPKNNRVGIDLFPEDQEKEIKKMNFLDFKLPINKSYIVIGNPPFGKNASLAKKFIQKSSEAEVIAFILPKSFKKHSFQMTFNEYFHIEYEEDLPFNSFLFNNKNYDVPCVFQIWIKKNIKNNLNIYIKKPNCIQFVNNQNDADLVIRRVGFYAGKIFKNQNLESKNKNTHYFIKSNIGINVFYEKYINNIFFEHNNTVGPRSVSKRELFHKLNEIF